MTTLLELPSVCLETIASYATPNDLCALDATSRVFCTSQVTNKAWAQQAKRAYGIEHCPGKQAWRKGKSLTDTERGFHCVFEVEPEEVSYNGPSLCCSSKTIVTLGDRWQSVIGERSFLGTNPLVLRDTKTFKQRAILSPNNRYWDASLGGLPGNEVIGIAYEYDSAHFAVAQEGGHYREYNMRELFPEHSSFFCDDNFLDMIMLASPNHFIISSANSSHLYLVKFNGSLPLSETNQITPVRAFSTGGGDICSIQWGGDDLLAGTFVLDQNAGSVDKNGGPNDQDGENNQGKRKLSVWRFDDSTSELMQLQTIEHSGPGYDVIAVSKRYIVGCLREEEGDLFAEEEDRKGTTYHVFDRSLGNKVAEFAEPATGYGRYIGPQMHIIGGLLVYTTCSKAEQSTDTLGIWNLSSGARGTSHRVSRDDSGGISSMVKIDGDGYTCFMGHVQEHGVATVWGFPESEQGLRNLQELMENHTYVSGPMSQKRKREISEEE